jgi:hypothetical protein
MPAATPSPTAPPTASITTPPPWANGLGYAGLLPFVLGAALVWTAIQCLARALTPTRPATQAGEGANVPTGRA